MVASWACTIVLTATLVGAASEAPLSVFESPAELNPQGKIDELVFARWRELDIEPARLCSDEVFVRRVFLDVIGTLPTAEEARAFLVDRNASKRSRLIDSLLERDEFADYWGMKWSDLLRVKAEFPINLWPNAAQAYHRWIRSCVKQNLPYDRFVREMLTANGSNFRVGQVNFYRAVQSKTPPGIAQAVALTFMGERAENWPPARLAGMAAFFAQLSYRPTGEWKEEIVTFDPDLAIGQTSPDAPVRAVFPDGIAANLSPGQDPRIVFAEWLIDDENPWFSRNIVNRVWCWLLGRGIIHEPDDIRPDNPPSNPELLGFLQKELVAAQYDLKHLFRLILNSQTYQLSSVARRDRPEAAVHFARYPLRRLEAEVLIDALNQITGTSEQYSSAIPEPFTYIPEGQRSIALPDGSITSSFLEMFGRPPRDTGLEGERSNRPTADQRLHLLNSSHIQRKIESSPKLQSLFQSAGGAVRKGNAARGGKSAKKKGRQGAGGSRANDASGRAANQPADVATMLYLTILSRFPADAELQKATEYMQSAASRREAAIDVAWALVNSAEFLYRH